MFQERTRNACSGCQRASQHELGDNSPEFVIMNVARKLLTKLASAITTPRKGVHFVQFLQRTEHGLHFAYLSGVALGGGYRYAAMGIIVCSALGWVLRATEEHG